MCATDLLWEGVRARGSEKNLGVTRFSGQRPLAETLSDPRLVRPRVHACATGPRSRVLVPFHRQTRVHLPSRTLGRIRAVHSWSMYTAARLRVDRTRGCAQTPTSLPFPGPTIAGHSLVHFGEDTGMPALGRSTPAYTALPPLELMNLSGDLVAFPFLFFSFFNRILCLFATLSFVRNSIASRFPERNRS